MTTGTESVSPRYEAIDSWSTADTVDAMLEGQLAAVAAIMAARGVMAAAADGAAARLAQGDGRIIYAGAGTSGRIAVQDGVELGPTFNWPRARLAYLLAGGMAALSQSVEGAEDDDDAARDEVALLGIGEHDVVIGIAASGRTPFTIAAIEAARASGALTIAIANNAATPLLAAAQHAIAVPTGAETIAGSTRMKAGTAQKVVVNLISTAIMLRLGRVYRGLMVDMVISNDKLRDRAGRIVAQLAGVSETAAIGAVERSGGDIKAAVLIALGARGDEAARLLGETGGGLRAAVAAFTGPRL